MVAYDPSAGPQLRAHGSGCKMYMDPTSHANKTMVTDLTAPNNWGGLENNCGGPTCTLHEQNLAQIGVMGVHA